MLQNILICVTLRWHRATFEVALTSKDVHRGCHVVYRGCYELWWPRRSGHCETAKFHTKIAQNLGHLEPWMWLRTSRGPPSKGKYPTNILATMGWKDFWSSIFIFMIFFKLFKGLKAIRFVNSVCTIFSLRKQCMYSLPNLSKLSLVASLRKQGMYLYITMRKNLPKTLDQLIFCKYTLVFSKCSQIH